MQILVLLLVFISLINENNGEIVQQPYESPNINSVEYKYTGSPVPTLYENYFIHFINLRSIYMSNSYIQTIENHAFKNLTSLEQIDLSLNQITKLSSGIFSDTPKLEVVILSNNRLKALKRNLFTNLTYLRTVDFQYNIISSIEENCFVNVPSLEAINLAYNNLTTLKMNIIDDSRNLKLLFLEKNPWDCDPNLCEIMHTAVTRFWQEQFVPICFSPNATRGSTWREVIELSMPAIITDLKDDVAVNKIHFQCHTCTSTTLSWRLENKTIARKNVQKSNNYSTVSTFVMDIKKFNNFEGNYTCLVDKCTTCVDSVYITLKPASTTTRIIVWTIVIFIIVSVTVFIIFFYGKPRKCNGTQLPLSLGKN